MKVVIVSKALVVGTYRRKLTELARLGAEVIAVVPREWREAGAVQRLERTDDESYTLVVTPMRFNGRFHLHYYPSLPRILRSIRPDVLHMDEEPYNLATYLALRSGQRTHIPSVFFTWQNLLRRYPPPFSLMEQGVYRMAEAGIAGSADAADVLQSKGFRKPVYEIPQFGVDAEVFAPSTAGKRPFTVGYPNRLVAAKAPILAIRSFARLPENSRLEIAGDGPMREQLEREIDALGLRDRVQVRSRIPSADMPTFLQSVDAVLLPSITMPNWKEQFGRILIESMACGVPVVASNSGEIPRVLGDGGIIVPEGDEEATAASLGRLQSEPDLRVALGRRGRERVLGEYTHERIAAATLDVYTRLISA